MADICVLYIIDLLRFGIPVQPLSIQHDFQDFFNCFNNFTDTVFLKEKIYSAMAA